MWKGNHWVFEATAKTVGTFMPSEVHLWGSLFPTKAMEKFKNLGVNKVLGVLVLATYILGFLLLLWFVSPSIIDCLK